MIASAALRLTVATLALLAARTAFASGPAIVVEADSGRVLHAERATDPWFPASITKLMTTYVALDMVRRGEASMDQLLTVSDASAALPPSKMAFKPGTQLRLDNALKIILVKSANDIAATIAENLGGSIEGFSARMNDTATELGMHESHFVNPHGLPDDRNQTSARDMAILARALFKEFPERQDLFDIGAIQFGRRVMRNTNGLIGRYPGADGMKTGFICAAGFNVVASATRDGRRLITVVLGSNSANERTLKAADLFERGFSSSTSIFSPSLDKLSTSALQSPPNMRAVICDRRGPMPEEEGQAGIGSEAENSGPSLMSPGLLAFAGSAPASRIVLGPRQAVQPVRVWIGPTPPSESDLAAQAAEEDKAGSNAKADKNAAKGKRTARVSTKLPAGAIEESSNGRTSIQLKPVSDEKKNAVKPGKVEADAKPLVIVPQGKAKTKAKAKPN